MSGNDNRDNASYRLDVTVDTPSTAYMLIDNRLGGEHGRESTHRFLVPPQCNGFWIRTGCQRMAV